MKPSQRNAFQHKIKEAETKVSATQRALLKFQKGSFVHSRLTERLDAEKKVVANLKEDFKFYKNR